MTDHPMTPARAKTVEAVETVARAMAASQGLDWDGKYKGTEYANHGYWLPLAQAAIAAHHAALREPTEAMWGGLARQIMMWMDLGERKTPESLLKHLERCVEQIPQWLLDEPEMKHLDHVISKGTRCVIIFTAMIDEAGKGEG